jgi:hypothetical protein
MAFSHKIVCGAGGSSVALSARWIGRSVGRCIINAASPPSFNIEVAAATTARST